MRGCASWSVPSLSACARRHVFAWRSPYNTAVYKYIYIYSIYCDDRFYYSTGKEHRNTGVWVVDPQRVKIDRRTRAFIENSDQPLLTVSLVFWTYLRCFFFLSKEHPAKTQISLRGCAGWCESSLGAHMQRYIILWYDSVMKYYTQPARINWSIRLLNFERMAHKTDYFSIRKTREKFFHMWIPLLSV